MQTEPAFKVGDLVSVCGARDEGRQGHIIGYLNRPDSWRYVVEFSDGSQADLDASHLRPVERSEKEAS